MLEKIGLEIAKKFFSLSLSPKINCYKKIEQRKK